MLTKNAETRALLSSVIETKVTRVELIDMVIDRLRDELRIEREKINAEIDKLEASGDLELSVNASVKLLQQAKAWILPESITLRKHTRREWNSLRDEYVNSETVHTLKIAVDLPADVKPPAAFLEAHARKNELEKALQEIDRRSAQLSAGRVKARSELVKQALEGTPEGAKVLEAIDMLGESVKAKLLGA